MNNSRVILSFMLCLIANSVYAQDQPSKVNFFSIGVEGSYNWINSFDLNIPNAVTSNNEKNKKLGYRVFIDYSLDQNITFELGYFGTENFRQTGIDQSTSSYNSTIKFNGVELSTLYKFNQGIPGLFVKVGITHATERASATILTSNTTLKNNKSGIGYLFGLGYEMALMENLDGRVAYTRYEKLAGDSDNKMNDIALGIKYNF